MRGHRPAPCSAWHVRPDMGLRVRQGMEASVTPLKPRPNLVALRLTDEQQAKADRLAEKLGVTRSEAIRRMIEAYKIR